VSRRRLHVFQLVQIGVSETQLCDRVQAGVPRTLYFSVGILLGQAQASDAEDLSKDESCQYTLWVRGVRRNVEVQVLGLLIQRGDQHVTRDRDGKVHKVDGRAGFFTSPI
jgi:hypothetical protein